METLVHTDQTLDPVITRKIPKMNLKDLDKKAIVDQKLPSIKNTKRFINLSIVSDTPRVKPNYSISPTRFPSIFKKYSQMSPV